MNKVLKHIALLVLTATPALLSAQWQQQAIDELATSLQGVERLFDTRVSLAEPTLSAADYDVDQSFADIERWSEVEKKLGKAETGLDLSGGYDRKFGSGSDDPYDDYYSYANRFHLVLTWNILNSGLIGSSLRSERVDLHREQKELTQMNYRDIAMINDSFALQCQAIDAHYNKLHSSKIEIYTQILKFQEYLKANGQATLIEIAQIELQIALSQAALRECPMQVDSLISNAHYLAKQSQISPEMIETMMQSNHILREGAIEADLLDNQAASVNYWQQARIAPYARAQHYSGSTFLHKPRVVGQVGMSFTLPLLSGNKSRRREVEARAKVHNNMLESRAETIKGEMMQVAREMNSNLQLLEISNKIIEAHEQKIAQAKRMHHTDHLPILRLSEQYISLLDAEIQLLDLIARREELKCRLLLLNYRN